MKRKIVKQGAATMMISLPAKWVKANALGKGDEIELEERGNSLIVGTEKTIKGRKEITIKIDSENKAAIRNLLTHIYRKGFDKIEIEGVDNSLLRKIKKIVNRLLLGFEVTDVKDDVCFIENISEPSEGKYEVMLRKVFMIINETQEMVKQDFENNDFENSKEIEETRDHHDKFVLFCRRLLMKEKPSNMVLEWELLTFLMHIQHCYSYMYKYAYENKVKIDKKVLKLLKDLEDYFKLFSDAYYHKTINSIHKIDNLKWNYQLGVCLKALEKSKKKNSVIYSYIREIFRLMQIGTSPILSELIEEEIKD